MANATAEVNTAEIIGRTVELVAGEGTSETAIYTAVATADRSNLFDSDMQKLLFRF